MWTKRLFVIGILFGLATWFVSNPTEAAGYVVGIGLWFIDACKAIITFAKTTITGIF